MIHSWHAAHEIVDVRPLDCMVYDVEMDAQHIGHSTIMDHETYTDDKGHVAASTMEPLIPMASILDCN